MHGRLGVVGAVLFVACSAGPHAGIGSSPEEPLVDAAPPWQPIAPASLAASCGAPLDPGPFAPRPSSLRLGSCDLGETADFTTFEPCEDGSYCGGPQTGDQLCHRVCTDETCAPGETCQTRLLFESDYTESADLCMCASGPCAQKTGDVSGAEGGLDAWRVEAPMPSDAYDHAAAASDRFLFVSGGLHVTDRQATSTTLEAVDSIYVADLDAQGAVSNWRPAGTLSAPTTNHAMAIAAGRLYVAGGQVDSTTRAFVDTAVSYPIAAERSLGAARQETKLLHPRGWHVLLVDPAGRLIVASGSEDASYFTSGTNTVAFAPFSAADGVVGSWTSVVAPEVLDFDADAALVGGALYASAGGDLSMPMPHALYGILLADLVAGTPPGAFVKSAVWPLDPLPDASDQGVRLTGVCDALAIVTDDGAVGTAAVSATAQVGAWRAAARYFGSSSNAAIASSPAGRIYVTGGSGDATSGTAVRSTSRR